MEAKSTQEAGEATWGQPPPAVRRSNAPLGLAPGKKAVELRSTGQPGAAVPTWVYELYQTRQAFSGTMGCPALQLNAF